MASKIGEITEYEVAMIAVSIGAARSDGIASYSALRKEVPMRHRLSAMDLIQSKKRPREKMWEQKIRNIKSHHEAEGNFIYEGYLTHVPRVGYRVTPMGRKLVERHAAA
ncbi:hypothetical protein JQ554_12440 [Bradyrhizobium diazoefficiens]|nr:hypothetical protein [Bradyrhizobium diazoefficiens]UCF52861.1 MAG: hypothetical protein JSV48_27540 [Bradyrhizobium sp.]MBR0964561.1 hypothetical protein [Bradyrhizobium diazoefficiens]MBR0978721.1 hypothetical protein [Bradyrhizobium diazoefficiens]MBR1008272.1 hypothetical protein [Bradyrhizobium diazoefficiens]MBR1013796.1 hypothetical protein [Bradyrhizobium diazoefficiens]